MARLRADPPAALGGHGAADGRSGEGRDGLPPTDGLGFSLPDAR